MTNMIETACASNFLSGIAIGAILMTVVCVAVLSVRFRRFEKDMQKTVDDTFQKGRTPAKTRMS